MTLKRSYYEILGVPKGATQPEIRNRYRELVRKYHPDVHPDKELAHRMLIQILEAYRVLGDPDSRAGYDRQLEREAAAQRPAPPPPRPTAAPAGSGRKAPALSEVDHLLSNARLDYLAGNMRGAAGYCRQALKMQPANAQAHVVLGDIYRLQGRLDEAMSMYTLAIQFDPHNIEIRQRITRLVHDERQKAEVVTHPGRASRRELLRVSVWSFGAAAAIGAVFVLSLFPGQPGWPQIAPISLLSENAVVVLMVLSLLTGLLLSLTNAVRRADEELVFSTVRGLPGGGRQSFGIHVVLLTLIWYYLGLFVYIMVAANNESLSSSVVKAYVGALAVVALVAIAVPVAAGQLFLLGANLSFGLVLLGWVAGDMFRPLA